MVRSYLRHEPTMAFGVIASNASARPVLDSDGKTAYVAALEDILVWDIKTGNQISLWHEISHRSPVTSLIRAPSPNAHLFAVGYQDGSLRIWDSKSSTPTLTLNGHDRAVTALAFDPSATRLASGSQDNQLILWDLVAERGLFRLRGHRDTITDIHFLSSTPSTSSSSNSHSLNSSSASGHLLSTSKDGLLKLWDLTLQHCLETVVPGKGEITSLNVLQGKKPKLTSEGDKGKGKQLDEEEEKEQDFILILTGSSEGEVRIWEIENERLENGIQSYENENGDSGIQEFITERGVLETANSGHRVSQISFSSLNDLEEIQDNEDEVGFENQERKEKGEVFLGIQSSDKNVQIFRIRKEEEVKKKLNRRRKRMREKAAEKKSKGGKEGKDEMEVEEKEEADEEDEVKWQDLLQPFTIVRPSAGKIRSFSFNTSGGKKNASSSTANSTPSILLAMTNNSLEIHSLPSIPLSKASKQIPLNSQLSSSLSLPGHRSDVRAICLSSDDSLLASASGSGELKIWNLKTGKCLRTLECGYALCLKWLRNDRHVLVGCKDGKLRSFDIMGSKELEVIEAHKGPIWSIDLMNDGNGAVTASADKEVKFWEFEMIEEEFGEELGKEVRSKLQGDDDEHSEDEEPAPPPTRPKRQQLSLAHVKTLKMTDDILFAKFSPDGKFLALALLDSTVKIFFSDSLKFFLSLYGHKLPVLSLDISSDSKLIITVSADKNVKIWGLDFGDCHRSLFAHSESIMSCGFEAGYQGGGLLGGREGSSHHFWTASKDGLLKHWDGDRFELIQTLEGHHGEIWSLTAGNTGKLCVTAGADKSIRVWEKTDEPLFLEEEREKEMEKNFESADNNGRTLETRAVGSLANGATSSNQEAVEELGQESLQVTKSTTETLMSGEKLLEALDLGDLDLKSQALPSGQRPNRSPILMAAFGPSEENPMAEKYVLKVVEKIPSAQLEDSLLVLPFDRIVSLIKYLDVWTKRDWNIALVGRILFFILRIHHSQIVANRVMKQTLNSLRKHLRAALNRQKTILGFNLAALQFIKTQHLEDRTAEMYEREGLDLDEDQVRAKIQENAKRKRKLVLT